MSLSIKALAARPAAAEQAEDTDAPAAEEPPAPPPKKRTTPLKGGLGDGSASGPFGLKW